MLLPPVIGFKLHGRLREGCTATDLVLTITQILRKKGVVGKFVEFYGAGPERPEPGRPRHRCQHGPRIRRHHGLLPRGRRNPGLPSPLQPPARTWIALVEAYTKAAGPVPHRRHPRPGLHGHPGTGPRRRSPPPWPAPSARRTAWNSPASARASRPTYPRPKRAPWPPSTASRIRRSPTVRWSSPPSPAAPTRRIRRSCWPRAWWPGRLSNAA